MILIRKIFTKFTFENHVKNIKNKLIEMKIALLTLPRPEYGSTTIMAFGTFIEKSSVILKRSEAQYNGVIIMGTSATIVAQKILINLKILEFFISYF